MTIYQRKKLTEVLNFLEKSKYESGDVIEDTIDFIRDLIFRDDGGKA